MTPPDSLIEQAKLVEWMAAGQVRAVHAREATPAEVFIARRGRAPGGVEKGRAYAPSSDPCYGAQRRAGCVAG
jgi:hypothetical protein